MDAAVCAHSCWNSQGEYQRDRSTTDTVRTTLWACPENIWESAWGKGLTGKQTCTAGEDSVHDYTARCPWLVPFQLCTKLAWEESLSSSVVPLWGCSCAQLAWVQPPRSPCGAACPHLIEGMSTQPLSCSLLIFHFNPCCVQKLKGKRNIPCK